jgi:tellurite resistance protein
MALLGSKGRTTTVERGVFRCPECGAERSYRKQKVQRFVAAEDLMLVPVARVGYHIECEGCEATFRTGVLAYGSLDDDNVFVAEFHAAILRTLVLMMVTDDEVHDAEVDAVVDIYRSVTGREPPEELVRQEIAAAIEPPRDAVGYLASVAPFLNVNGKRLVLRAAAAMAAADGTLTTGERSLLAALAHAVDIDEAERDAILEAAVHERDD